MSIPVGSDEPSNAVRQTTFFNTIDKNANEIEVLQKSGINYTDAVVVQTVTNGDTTHAPSGDAVFDFVAAADTALLATTVTNGDTTHAPTGNAVFDYVEAKRITDTAALDWGSIPAHSTSSLTMTVTGAAVGDAVALGPPELVSGLVATGWVSAADTVKIRLANVTTGAIDPVSQTWRATVFK